MKIVGYTCCVNYLDLFRLTHHYNKNFFNDIIVVTSTDDAATARYCYDNGVYAIQSDIYKADGARFNRGAMLNLAAGYISRSYMDDEIRVCCFDADTIIRKIDGHNFDMMDKIWTAGIAGPNRAFGCKLENANDIETCHGAPRRIVKHEDCKNGISLKWLQSVSTDFIYPYEQYGYVGHFQYYRNRGARFDHKITGVDNSDTEFLRRNFVKLTTITDVMCYHLGDTGKNWNGRTNEDWSKIQCVD